jgi:hypothetical protein
MGSGARPRGAFRPRALPIYRAMGTRGMISAWRTSGLRKWKSRPRGTALNFLAYSFIKPRYL